MGEFQKEKFRGCLLGLAVGDALGAPIELETPGSFKPILGMRSGGYFNLAPGEWTDDTALALCSAESLVKKRQFDPYDHLSRFLRWYRAGYMSIRRKPTGTGLITASALLRFESTGENFCGPTGEKTAENGSLMRIAPVPLFYARNPKAAIRLAGIASCITHGARDAVDACRYVAALIVGGLRGHKKSDLLHPLFDAVAPGVWKNNPLSRAVRKAITGAIKGPPKIDRNNYTQAIIALHAALWAFSVSETFKDGVLRVVNLGWDADTMGAVYGQIAGTYYGESSIPRKWIRTVKMRAKICKLADSIFGIAARS